MAAEKELARREAAAARAARAAGRLRDEAEAASVLAERERRARDGAIAARDAARASVAAVERGLGIR